MCVCCVRHESINKCIDREAEQQKRMVHKTDHAVCCFCLAGCCESHVSHPRVIAGHNRSLHLQHSNTIRTIRPEHSFSIVSKLRIFVF